MSWFWTGGQHGRKMAHMGDTITHYTSPHVNTNLNLVQMLHGNDNTNNEGIEGDEQSKKVYIHDTSGSLKL